jgi:hypothetical protein
MFLKTPYLYTNTMSSIPATINEVLTLYSNLLSDVGKEISLPGNPKTGWKRYSEMFCDSVILWALCPDDGNMNQHKKNAVATICDMMEDLDVNRSMVKVVNQGKVHGRHSFFSRSNLRKYRELHEDYNLAYVSIKVALHEHDLVSLRPMLRPILRELADNFIYMHDMDIATDCQYVTSRPILETYLKEQYDDDDDDELLDIVDDLDKVGNHCLSWILYTYKDQKIRCKMYNKFVQMMESAETRMSLGSRMEDLVMAQDKKLHKRLRKAKKRGLSRLEITFHGKKMRKFAYYEEVVECIKDQLQDCPTYSVSFRKYWRYMASTITSMVGVHIVSEDTTAFAYCHWWNSITKKKYGSYRNKVGKDEAMKALANYSFNDRPIYLLEVEVEDGTIKNVVTTKYKRPNGCTEITLVAGKHKSLYPYRYHDKVLNFRRMGIVKMDNIKIRWPIERLYKRSPPIVDIYQEDMMMETFIRIQDSIPHKMQYKPGYQVLEERREYTIIAIGEDIYRKRQYYFATMSTGIKIRCGKSLECKIDAYLQRYPDGEAPHMPFTTTTKKRVRGYDDIHIA